MTAQVVEEIHRRSREIAAVEGCTAEMTEESYSGTVHFTPELTRAWRPRYGGPSRVPPHWPPGPGTTPGCWPHMCSG